MIINFNYQVDLLLTPDFIWKDRFHGAAQRWWILVEVMIKLPCLVTVHSMVLDAILKKG